METYENTMNDLGEAIRGLVESLWPSDAVDLLILLAVAYLVWRFVIPTVKLFGMISYIATYGLLHSRTPRPDKDFQADAETSARLISQTEDWVEKKGYWSIPQDMPLGWIRAVAASNHPLVLRDVARCSRTPVDILERLADHPDARVRAGLGGNLSVPHSVRDRLSEDRAPEVRAAFEEHRAQRRPGRRLG